MLKGFAYAEAENERLLSNGYDKYCEDDHQDISVNAGLEDEYEDRLIIND